jgi:LPPG:FO 2-phospho-L-lactate transferase
VICVLAGGVGAARLLRGLAQLVPPSELVAIGNTGDDLVLHGLHVSPDLDTVTYTLAGLADEAQGWGRREERWTVMEELERLGGQTWFRLGDRDLATHLYRTQRLAEGATLTEVTAELVARLGAPLRLLPMSDDPVRTRLTLADGREVAFQEYFVALRHQVPVRAVRYLGAEAAQPAPGVLRAIAEAERIVVAPSNPILSIGPVLAVPGVRPALAARRDDVVAVSPLIGGRAVKGPADRLLAELGHDASSAAVARFYAELAGTLVLDHQDRDDVASVQAAGVRAVLAPTLMSDLARATELARVVLAAGPASVPAPDPA